MSNNFYTCFLMGGLGNQMFQIANCITRAKENGASVFLRKNSYTPLQGKNTSSYINNIFRKLNFVDELPSTLRISEKSFSFHSQPIPKLTNVEFYGYFQSSKYFQNNQEEIKNLFLPNPEFVKTYIGIFPQLNEKNTVSIHVRRGDYTNNPHIHPSIGISYIKECLRIIGKFSHILVFSDDHDWCEKNIKEKNVTFVKLQNDWEELWVMSLCNHNIISNSTFSWWASFLNQNTDKKVFCPSVWFGPGGYQDYQDIYVEGWNKINTTLINGELCF